MYQKIIIPTRPHLDTIIAIFLLRKFGREKYPGIEKAKIEIWSTLPKNETPDSLFKEGCLLIDIGNGKFDHHSKKKTASYLVAKDLNITNDLALNKLLIYAERDDKYGLGTISSDPIDKAFGLSALITNLNKILSQNPQQVVEIILPIIHAHYKEERRRHKELPEEFERKLKQGKAEIFAAQQGKKKKLKLVAIESDNPSIAGWLRSSIGLKADIVLQKTSSGHVNIITRPLKKVDLRSTAALLRKEEILIQNRKINLSLYDLNRPGRISEIPEWYFDLATNSILNGGINIKNTPPTSIPFENIKKLLIKGLSQ